jgi:murein DD-endopeptidase MepM/ murein hydrolase activator NlpD
VEEPFTPTQSHSAYAEGLQEMQLADTAMGALWLEEAQDALDNPVPVQLPFREEGIFDPASPEAWGYRFSVDRGREVIIRLSLPPEEQLKVFADVFRVEENGEEREVHHVASYSRQENQIRFETLREGRYLLRLQPELLRGGRFSLSIRHEPLLSFPVEGADTGDIHSFFGAPRDGGSRRHEGVDIFSGRGTPVLAVTEAVVRRVGTRDLGGKIVLLWDEKRQLHYYYAHLDRRLTTAGVRVEPGDVIGLMGNTGNARTTPPHLHFGVYKPWFDALDPLSFLSPSSGEPVQPVMESEELGRWMLVEAGEAVPLTAPDTGAAEAGSYSLPSGTPLRAVGSAGDYVRVRLPAGDRHAFLPARALAAASADRLTVSRQDYLYPAPRRSAPASGRVQSGEELTLIGSWNGYRLVRRSNGSTGWLPSS